MVEVAGLRQWGGLVGVLACAACHGQEPTTTPDVLAMGKQALVLQLPRAVGNSGVKQVLWTTDGEWLMVRCEQSAPLNPTTGRQAPRGQLVAYDVVTGASRVLWKYDPAGMKVTFHWMPASHSGVVDAIQIEPLLGPESPVKNLHGGTQQVVLVRPEGDDITLFTAQEPNLAEVHVSPSKAVGMVDRLVRGDQPAFDIVDFDDQGRTSAVGSLALNPAWVMTTFGFAADGVRPQFQGFRRDAGKTIRDSFVLDPSTKSMIPSNVDPGFEPKPIPPSNLSVDSEVSRSSAGPHATRHTLWLRVKDLPKPGLLVTTDGDLPSLDPTGHFLFYRHDGVGLVRTIDVVSGDAGAQMSAEADRTLAMAIAGSIASSVHTSVILSDGRFFGSSDWAEKAREHMFSYTDELALFVYTAPSGAVAHDNPQAEVGYFPTPSGRAVVYGDFSVKWLAARAGS